MRKQFVVVLLAAASLAMAQPQKPKTKSEGEALMAIQAEQDPKEKIAKVDAFVAKFADTDFKPWAYTQAAESAQRLNDSPKVIIYADLALEADPKAYHPMLMESAELARTTRENDLDKEEKLTKADKLARQAMTLIPDVAKPNDKIPDDQWAEIKKEFLADAHQDLGMIASVRKKYDVAIAEYKQATEIPAQPDQPTFIRLAGAYNDNKQPDEALAVLAKMPANPQLQAFVDREKKRAELIKAAKK
jgi:tetratricopeptide (TPR) repeat protein